MLYDGNQVAEKEELRDGQLGLHVTHCHCQTGQAREGKSRRRGGSKWQRYCRDASRCKEGLSCQCAAWCSDSQEAQPPVNAEVLANLFLNQFLHQPYMVKSLISIYRGKSVWFATKMYSLPQIGHSPYAPVSSLLSQISFTPSATTPLTLSTFNPRKLITSPAHVLISCIHKYSHFANNN